jgi:two-component system, OmpR family, phosphate regulon sensor histidine kinase PhoR
VRSSLRNRLLALFLVLVVIVGAATLYAIERTLADDLVSALDTRLTQQGRAVAGWLADVADVEALAPRVAAVTGTRLTIVDGDGVVQGDSHEPSMTGRQLAAAPEISDARRGQVARAVRELAPAEPTQYLVAVPTGRGGVVRLAVPLGEIHETRARMRKRLLVGFGFGFLGALLLSWIFVRAVTRPIQAMTRTAEQLAAGRYDAPPPAAATQAGGEIGVLARAMMHMAGEVKSRVDELTEQRDLLSVVVGGLVEGVVVVDPDGNILLANAAAKPLVGTRLPPPIASLVEQARDGGQPEEELELQGRTVRASARPLRTTATTGEHRLVAGPGDPRRPHTQPGEVKRARSQAGDPQRAQSQPTSAPPSVIVVLYDITRMRALESVRREFLSNAAHELRTPVTSISGYAETLLGGGVDAETSREFITTIHRNARRIADMVSDLMVLDQLGGRAEAVGHRVAVPIVEVVDHAVRTTKGVRPDAQIDVDVPASVTALATREGLDHVVQNLVDNAVKYGGGAPVTVRARSEAGRVRVVVEDRGAGIPEGHEERIFERFYRVDAGRSRDQGGSGLGLAIVKSQIEAMGGRVWFEHAEPGARFVIELDHPPQSSGDRTHSVPSQSS